MKTPLAISLIVAATFAWAVEPAPAAPVVTGQVLEVKDVESYTYLRLKTKDGETWAAVSKSAVRQGTDVTLENVMVMRNFESKALKKTFPSIVFGTLQGAGAHGSKALGAAPVKAAEAADVKVAKASGPNARTVAEVVTKAAELKDKPVLIHAKVVKYNAAIMGKNWIHLRDGSGSAADNTNDILATSMNQAKVGDVVTLKGVVRTDKDFGSGYAYKVIVEDATLQQ